MADYLIIYFDKGGETLRENKLWAWDHWEACETGWKKAPKQAADFRIYTAEEYLQLTGTALASREARNINTRKPRHRPKS